MDTPLFDHLCSLCKIGVEPEDQEQAISEMSRIIDLMDTIRFVEPTPFPPAPGLTLDELREDLSAPSLSREAVLQNATDPQDGCFTVPKIME